MSENRNSVVAVYESHVETERAIVGVLEGAVFIGGLSALGAGLYSLGIPKNSILEYEAAIKVGKYMIIAHGTKDKVSKARDILSTTESSCVDVYRAESEAAVSGAGS